MNDLHTFIRIYGYEPRKTYPSKAEFKTTTLDESKIEAKRIIQENKLNLRVVQPVSLINLGIFEVATNDPK